MKWILVPATLITECCLPDWLISSGVIQMMYTQLNKYQWFFQNSWLLYHAGFVNGVSNIHQATNPRTSTDIKNILWGSLYVKISAKSGNPMWLQKAWAANGATKWPAINTKTIMYRQHSQISMLWDTNNVAEYWKWQDTGNGQVEGSQFLLNILSTVWYTRSFLSHILNISYEYG